MTPPLSPNELLSIPEISRLLSLIEKYDQAWLTGGRVRDSIFSLHHSLPLPLPRKNGVDITTSLHWHKLLEIIPRLPLSHVMVNHQHRSLSATFENSLNVDITTLRIDHTTNGRHAKTLHTDDPYQDSLRRDFSMNALYLSTSGNLLDFHKGLDDIKNRQIQFINNPEVSLQQDSLRILRFIRFLSPFQDMSKTINPSYISSIVKFSGNLSNLSNMRKGQELINMLTTPEPIIAIDFIKSHRLDHHFFPFPSLSQDITKKLKERDWHKRLFILISHLPEPKHALSRLELSKKDKKIVLNYFTHDDRDDHPKCS